jgi:phosphatidylserine decarboxylase
MLVSGAVSRAYSRLYRVNIGEAAAPHGCYRSFDAFFTRSLREGIRPISDARIVSPCDGVISSLGPIDDGARLFVKGHPYEVGELLGQSNLSRDFIGGHYAVIYLSPRDYHRVHSPVDGLLSRVFAIPGDCFPVNALGERCVPQLFVRNRRVVFFIETDDNKTMALIMVGALIVGKITVNALGDGDVSQGLHDLGTGLHIQRGDEIGAFHLGSTVVLLAPPGLTLNATEGKVVYGQSLTRGLA